MEITILGSGTHIPTRKQNSSGYLIEFDQEYILVDCGSGTIRRFIDFDFDFRKINHIFITHTHPDHITDLPSIIFFQLKRKKSLKIYGPKNIKPFANFVRKEMTEKCKPPRFLFYDLTAKKIKIKKLIVQTLPIKHSSHIPEVAYKFSTDKKVMVYSGDIGPTIDKKKFIKFCQNADLLIADSKGGPGGHFAPYEVGALAQQAKVKTLVLTHQLVKSEKIITSECKKSYSGKIIVAKDLMKIKL